MEPIRNFTSIEQVQAQYLNNRVSDSKKVGDTKSPFEEILASKLGATPELKFSKHALGRLDSRGITLSEDVTARLNDGFAKAESKGIKDSLVLVDSLAFIVNVPNATVVTAMDQLDTTRDNIFTNIDGAVIA